MSVDVQGTQAPEPLGQRGGDAMMTGQYKGSWPIRHYWGLMNVSFSKEK